MIIILKGIDKMEFTTKAELIEFLTDLEGRLANLQEQLDKLAPVTTDPEPQGDPDPQTDPETEPTDDELEALLLGE